MQIREALQPKAAFAVHIEMGGIWRIEVLPLTKIGTDRLGTESMHIALFHKPLYDGGLRPRRVSAVVAQSGIIRIGLLRPVRAQQDPTSRLDLAVARLPLLDKGNRQREIRVGGALLRTIDHRSRGDEMRDVDRIDGVVGQILARNPVDRRVEVRSGMLAETDVVPIPSRSAFVVPRHLLHSERRALSQLGRQHDGREFLRQRLRQVDDTDVAVGDRAREGHEIDCHRDTLQLASSRSSAFGLTARRCRMSSATSPTNTSSRPCWRARTTALASAAGVTFGGGTVWNHSVSSGPKNTFTTLTPPGRSSARMHCAADRQAASVAE